MSGPRLVTEARADAPEGASPAVAPVRSDAAPLDARATAQEALLERERDLFERIGRRIDNGKLELPYLATTSMSVIELAQNPGVELQEIVRLLSTDPTLSSELLRTANSALYASHAPAETLHDATMRIGMRALRSLIFSVSLRGAVFRGAGLSEYAEEVWRQSYSVGNIARAIAAKLAIPPEKAFLLGLLHDIGKVALLAGLRREMPKDGDLTRALVGKVFALYHERAGSEMAKRWQLPEEFVSVCGNHHDFRSNAEHGRSAALVSLAHRLHLYLSLRDQDGYLKLTACDELEFLGVPNEARYPLLVAANTAYMDGQQSAAAVPVAA